MYWVCHDPHNFFQEMEFLKKLHLDSTYGLKRWIHQVLKVMGKDQPLKHDGYLMSLIFSRLTQQFSLLFHSLFTLSLSFVQLLAYSFHFTSIKRSKAHLHSRQVYLYRIMMHYLIRLKMYQTFHLSRFQRKHCYLWVELVERLQVGSGIFGWRRNPWQCYIELFKVFDHHTEVCCLHQCHWKVDWYCFFELGPWHHELQFSASFFFSQESFFHYSYSFEAYLDIT